MREVAEGVWLLESFPRYWVNVYLAGNVLIDAATRWARPRIFRDLRGRSLHQLALTHCHPDHQGVARALCQRFRVPLACHELEASAVEGKAPMQPDNRILQLGRWALAGPSQRVDRLLRDGDELAGFRVIHAPGHTPGHCIYFRESDRVTLAGDLLANIHFLTGRPGLREPPWFFSADPARNRQSIRLLADLNPSLVCFGHGPPLEDLSLLKRFAATLG